MAQKGLIGTAAIDTGRYRARLAENRDDVARAKRLRARMFRSDPKAGDGDGFDRRCRHVLVEARVSGEIVCTFRLLDFADGGGVNESYAAQFYDLGRLGGFAGRMIEMGRFCIAPEARDADVLRLAWAMLTRIVEAERVEMLFGCSSFVGIDETDLRDVFALLGRHHRAPVEWRPRVRARDVIRFARVARNDPDLRRARRAMPPLLRSYLLMGGWVSDHAVRDRDLGTLHVFTGLEVARVPASRRRALSVLGGT